ncbi:SepM family pheromone-processing serine protease [Alkalicoccobacillus murimartini]|uniref:PDZ domain-containing protein n=1 Tax=Alkalicoccobacillus murimartini TaxID=171685 RepID=A0ABT9YF55_9BACI|nr:SepM family pheromone-processing serine protease [Alkalicoccobacillus murimartini]MDQ0206462.1 PDZ domain-containing protein [Alkalicoccobacillus murimartini]
MSEPRKPFFKMRYLLIFIAIFLLNFIQLPYYYSQPGIAQELEDVISVEGTNGIEEGGFMLTTIELAKATPMYYAWSFFSSYRHIIPEEQVRGADETDSDYHERQSLLMSNSQEMAKIAAYEHADADVTYEYHGVLITTLMEGMPAVEKLEVGDLVTAINGEPVHTAEDLLDLLSGYAEDDQVELLIVRDGETIEVELGFSEFPEEYNVEDGRVGLGILSPITDRDVTYSPNVTIDETEIGGPSAGLMYSLEIYNQLVPEDITHGYLIAGTGTINDEGIVGPIGGASQKVVAADKAGAVYFFAPNVGGGQGETNYEEAKAAAEDIGTEMQVIPVESLEDALLFLEELSDQES